jgi:uncharacterized protein YndB with AHSA1/START domain
MSNNMNTNISADGVITIIREFKAERALIWSMLTEAEHVAKWYGPKGLSGSVRTMDLRVGGSYHWVMTGPGGQEHHAVGVYREVSPVERPVFTQERGNAAGQRVDGPVPETLITIVLEEIGTGTRMIMTHAGIPPGEWSEMAAIGWNQAFDKIDLAI